MENFYEHNAHINISLSDAQTRVSLKSILDLFQDAVTVHTYTMGVDAHSMKTKCNDFWVVSKTCFHIYDYPKWQQDVVVGTYPLPPTRLRGERQYYIDDADGNLLIAGMSDWCVLNCETQSLVKIADVPIYPFGMEHRRDKVYTCTHTKPMVAFSQDDYIYTKKVCFSDLDFNLHVNNAQYMSFVMDCYDSQKWKNCNITDVEIDYLSQCREGEHIDMYAKQCENALCFCGKSNDREIFKCFLFSQTEK